MFRGLGSWGLGFPSGVSHTSFTPGILHGFESVRAIERHTERVRERESERERQRERHTERVREERERERDREGERDVEHFRVR